MQTGNMQINAEWIDTKELKKKKTMLKNLCGSQQTEENSLRDGNTKPPYLTPEKAVCRSRSDS